MQPARDGGKQGLDDFIAAGGDVHELLATCATVAEDTGDLLDFHYTDLGNAHRFVAMHATRFRHSREENRWLEWRDGRWRRDVTGAAERAGAEVVETMSAQVARLPDERRKAAAAWALRSQSSAAIQAMLKVASSDAELVVRLDQLDADPYLLSCGNGTLDLRTGELREPDPADLITLGTGPTGARTPTGTAQRSLRSTSRNARRSFVRSTIPRPGSRSSVPCCSPNMSAGSATGSRSVGRRCPPTQGA